jgi:ATP-dependent Zn protease
VNLRSIARGTPGFSGADLANLVNERRWPPAAEDASRVSGKDMDRRATRC